MKTSWSHLYDLQGPRHNEAEAVNTLPSVVEQVTRGTAQKVGATVHGARCTVQVMAILVYHKLYVLFTIFNLSLYVQIYTAAFIFNELALGANSVIELPYPSVFIVCLSAPLQKKNISGGCGDLWSKKVFLILAQNHDGLLTEP